MVYFDEELATFGYGVGFFVARILKLFFLKKILILVSQGKSNTFVVRPVTIGKGVAGIALESEGRKGRVDNLGESVWCSAGVEAGSNKTEVCDSKNHTIWCQ
jgi:hypothetical protein